MPGWDRPGGWALEAAVRLNEAREVAVTDEASNYVARWGLG